MVHSNFVWSSLLSYKKPSRNRADILPKACSKWINITFQITLVASLMYLLYRGFVGVLATLFETFRGFHPHFCAIWCLKRPSRGDFRCLWRKGDLYWVWWLENLSPYKMLRAAKRTLNIARSKSHAETIMFSTHEIQHESAPGKDSLARRKYFKKPANTLGKRGGFEG